MKICIKCNIEKEYFDFYKNKSNKDGYGGKCKDCTKIDVKAYRDNNLDKAKKAVNDYRSRNLEKSVEYSKIWREENKEYKKEKDREYSFKNKEIIKERSRIWYENNKEYSKEKARIWREENREYKKEKDREYSLKNKDKRNKRHYARMLEDPLYNLSHSIRGLLYISINKKYSKNSKTQEILGCSFEEFKLYLESKFEDWMTWENKGLYNGELNYGWDIDHIIPTSSAETEEDIIRLNHYTNLQPLCSYTNRYIKKDLI